MSAVGRLAGDAWRSSRRFVRDATPRDTTRLKRRMRIDPNWREPLDGVAPRLGARDSIEVTRVGRFREIDPHRTVEGWRDPWKAVGFGSWVAIVGVAWWLGSTKGRGPLSLLAEDHERAF